MSFEVTIETDEALIKADDLTDGKGIELAISQNEPDKNAFIYLTPMQAHAFAQLIISMTKDKI